MALHAAVCAARKMTYAVDLARGRAAAQGSTSRSRPRLRRDRARCQQRQPLRDHLERRMREWEEANAGDSGILSAPGGCSVRIMRREDLDGACALISRAFMSTQAGRVTSNVRDFLESQLEDRAKGVTLIVEEPRKDEEDAKAARIVGAVSLALSAGIENVDDSDVLAELSSRYTLLYLSNMVTLPSLRKRGIASQILRAAEDLAQILVLATEEDKETLTPHKPVLIALHVDSDQVAARALYSKV